MASPGLPAIYIRAKYGNKNSLHIVECCVGVRIIARLSVLTLEGYRHPLKFFVLTSFKGSRSFLQCCIQVHVRLQNWASHVLRVASKATAGVGKYPAI